MDDSEVLSETVGVFPEDCFSIGAAGWFESGCVFLKEGAFSDSGLLALGVCMPLDGSS